MRHDGICTTVRSEYIHSTGKAFAKSITNFNDANAKDCNLNANIGDKAQGVYGLVIAPLAQLPKNSRIDVKARYDMYQPNGKSNMQRTQYEAGLNFHIGKRLFELGDKFYFEDLGIRNHIIGGNRRFDIEKVMENAVYIHLCRMGYKVYVGQMYKPEMRERIRQVMRYSGPRMIIYDPKTALWHMLCTIKERILK